MRFGTPPFNEPVSLYDPDPPHCVTVCGAGPALEGLSASPRTLSEVVRSWDGGEPLSLEALPDSVASARLMAASARRMLGLQSAAMEQGFDWLRAARQERDVIALQCVNEALSAITGLRRLTGSVVESLDAAVVRGDLPTVRHEYIKAAIATLKIRELVHRMSHCSRATAPREGGGSETTAQAGSTAPKLCWSRPASTPRPAGSDPVVAPGLHPSVASTTGHPVHR